MSERSKLTSSQLRRQAFVYLRQSSQAQVERNVESTARQYALVTRAVELGFTREPVVVIDEDLGISGSGLSERSGFARLTAEVALGHAGLVLGLEVSRLARNNVDWYRLLDLCGVTDTVIGDADGIYHPGSFNDRLLLGLKGTMSEAELHVLRARLQGGIRNKAERGELRKALPVGLVWGEADGEILLDPETKRSAARSRRSSTGSPNWGRSARSGCGCAASGCSSRCVASRTASMSGRSRPTIRSTACSTALSTPARTRSGRPAGSAMSTSTATRASGCVVSPKQNGAS
jgi:DNA invertase Pin-like site-specific DNA recombinase